MTTKEIEAFFIGGSIAFYLTLIVLIIIGAV